MVDISNGTCYRCRYRDSRWTGFRFSSVLHFTSIDYIFKKSIQPESCKIKILNEFNACAPIHSGFKMQLLIKLSAKYLPALSIYLAQEYLAYANRRTVQSCLYFCQTLQCRLRHRLRLVLPLPTRLLCDLHAGAC